MMKWKRRYNERSGDETSTQADCPRCSQVLLRASYCRTRGETPAIPLMLEYEGVARSSGSLPAVNM